MKTFRTYQLAKQFYQACRRLPMDEHLKEQLLRSSSSVALNVAEGYGRGSSRDQARCYQIAMGSLRESQAILELAELNDSAALKLADSLGAHIFKLIGARKHGGEPEFGYRPTAFPLRPGAPPTDP
jgi:four helix bundle protein